MAPPNTLLTSPEEISLETCVHTLRLHPLSLAHVHTYSRGDRNDGPKRTIEGERQCVDSVHLSPEQLTYPMGHRHPNVADRENLEKDVPGYGSSLNLATPDFSTHLLIGPGDRSDTVRGWQSGERYACSS